MIENRVACSQKLLEDSGLFFSSIDRDENRNYLPLLFSIFGEENFVEEIVWQKSYGGGAKTKHINNLHEYVHAFAANKDAVPFLSLPLTLMRFGTTNSRMRSSPPEEHLELNH